MDTLRKELRLGLSDRPNNAKFADCLDKKVAWLVVFSHSGTPPLSLRINRLVRLSG
jgi:hypothetical protein